MICPSCGQDTGGSNQFCINCGAQVSAPPAQGAAPPPPGPPGPPGQPAAPPPPPGVGAPGAQAPGAQPPVAAQPAAPGGMPAAVPPPAGTTPPAAGQKPPQPMEVTRPPTQAPSPPRPAPQAPPAGATQQMPAQGAMPYVPPGAPGQYGAPMQPGPQYPPQTMQMPQQQYQQPYQQQYYPPPPAYGAQAPGRQPYAPPYARKAARAGAPVLGLIGLILGAAVVGSTFLPWISVSGFSATGWEIMRQGVSGTGGSSITLIATGEGTIFFTGFFSLLLGALLVSAGLMMIFRKRVGGVLAFIFALLATGVAAVNIAMVFTKLNGVTPGVGLWTFAGASLVVLALGIVGMASG